MTSEAMPAAAAATSERAETKQPGVLYMLFATEAWERFSYYGMRAILKLYMMKMLLFAQGTASLIYGFYTGLVYLTPLLGGYLADRVLGYRTAILLGGVVMACGQFFLSVPSQTCFFAGLLCLIVGNGFFKPNISTIVGTLYKEGDPRRDRGFTIFYMGINLGATLSPLICGQLLGENEALGSQSFPWGFRAAGIGMIVGLITFAIGKGWLGDRGRSPRQLQAKSAPASGGVGGPARSTGAGADKPEPHVDAPLTNLEKRRVLCLLLIGLFTIAFWMAFEQAGNTMTTWADERTNRVIFGWQVKASLFQFVNPACILIFAPIVSWVWKILDERRAEPSSPMKMVLGLSFLGFGFVPLVAAAALAGPDGKASWVWLIIAYVLDTIGELCLSPVGLSLVTKLAPKKLAALLMGSWFMFVWAGNTVAGVAGYWYDKTSHVVFFGMFVATSLLAAAGLVALLKPIKSLMGGVH